MKEEVKNGYPEMAPTWAVHQIEVDLVAAGGFSGTVVKMVGGNVKGGGLIAGLVSELVDDFMPDMEIELNAKHCRVVTEQEDSDAVGYIAEYLLYNEQGEIEAISYENIERHIIGIRITDCWPEER